MINYKKIFKCFKKNEFVNTFRFFLTITSFVYIIVLIFNNKTNILLLDWLNFPKVVLISFFPSFIGMLFQVKQFQLVLLSEQINLPYQTILLIMAKSNIARYIPGGIWNHLSIGMDLNNRLRKKITINEITKILILNTFIILISGFVFLVFFIPKKYFAIFLITCLFTLILLQKLLKEYIKKINIMKILISYLYSLLFWIFSAFSFYLFFILLTKQNNIDFYNSLKIGASFVVSWVIGFLAIPIPSGLGIREFAMNILLENTKLIVNIGVTLSFSYRLLILFRDLIVMIFAKLLVITKKQKN